MRDSSEMGKKALDWCKTKQLIEAEQIAPLCAEFALSVRDTALEECVNLAESYDADRVAAAIRAKIGGRG